MSRLTREILKGYTKDVLIDMILSYDRFLEQENHLPWGEGENIDE